LKLGNFNGIQDKIAAWEKKYPLANFTNPEIIRKIKAILNKEFLSRLIGDFLAAKVLHERKKQLQAYKNLKEIIDYANKTKDYKSAIKKTKKWKENLAANGLSIYSFDRYYRPKVCSLLLVPSKKLKNQEEATQSLKELIEKGPSLDSKTYSEELNCWQNKYCVKNFPDTLQTEINEITSNLLKSIHTKKQEEHALVELQTILTSSSDVNPLNSIVLILSQYDYTHFSDDVKKQIDSITRTAVSLNEQSYKEVLNSDIKDDNMISKKTTSYIQLEALNQLKDIFSKNSHDLEGLLNWIYIHRKMNFTPYSRDEIIKQFISAGYKIPSKASYYIPEINVNLTYKNFSKIDEIRKDVILNFLGIISQGNSISTIGKNNLEKIHYTSEQEKLINTTAENDTLIVLPVFDNELTTSSSFEDTIYDETGTIRDNEKDEFIIVIEDILEDPLETYEILPSNSKEIITTPSDKKTEVFESSLLNKESINQTPMDSVNISTVVSNDTLDVSFLSEQPIDFSMETIIDTSPSTNITTETEISQDYKNDNSREFSPLYTLSLENQQNIEAANNESIYMVVASSIISLALSRTQKTLTLESQEEIEPEKNNGF